MKKFASKIKIEAKFKDLQLVFQSRHRAQFAPYKIQAMYRDTWWPINGSILHLRFEPRFEYDPGAWRTAPLWVRMCSAGCIFYTSTLLAFIERYVGSSFTKRDLGGTMVWKRSSGLACSQLK